MNTSYRNLWNPVLGTWVAVSELTRTRGKRSRGGRCGRISLSIRVAIVSLLAGLASPSAMAGCTATGLTVICTGSANPVAPNYASGANNLSVNIISSAELGVLSGVGGTALSLTGNNITLINSGTIDPSVLGDSSILSSGAVIGNANNSTVNITNDSNGVIKGTTGLISSTLPNLNGMALNVNNGTNGTTRIVNNGSISSSALSGAQGVQLADAAVVAVRGGSSVEMTNSSMGIITGRVAFESSTNGNSFLNAGIIMGSVSLGASGNNTFTAMTTSIISAAGGTASSLAVTGNAGLTFAATGTVDGGAGGNNTLILDGNGTSIASSAVYTNFNKLTVNAGIWNLQGPLVSDSTTLNGGTAMFNYNGTFGTGTLTSNGGTVQASNGGLNLLNAIALGTGGLTVQGNNDLALSGTITGNGSLNKVGTATLTLTGANDYTGGTTVSAGALQGNSNSLQGAITNNANVIFNQASNGTYAGNMDGSGRLTKTGTGTLILAGSNNYAGGTFINAGTLQGDSLSLQGNITNNAALVFDQAGTGTYAGGISGSGWLTKTGAGTLTLSGVNTYVSDTAINNGTLIVNGSINNSFINVNNGGTLSGSGTVASMEVNTGGVLAPGNTSGTLTVNGVLAFAPGSSYRVQVDADGHADRVNTDSAILAGSTVDVRASSGNYAANTTYTILNASSGLFGAGTFDGVTSNLAFLTPTLSYDANNVFLNLARNDISFNSVANTQNQIAISNSLQSLGIAATGDMNTIITALTGLSAEQARASYDAMSGASLSAMSRAGAGFSAGVGSQMRARLAAVSGNSTSAYAFGTPVQLTGKDHVYDLFSAATPTASQSSSASSSLTGLGASADTSLNSYGRGFWLRGYGNYQSTSSDGNGVASTVRSNGLSLGFDTEVSEGLIVGVAGTFGKSSLRFDSNDTGRSRDRAIAAYASYKTGPWNFNGSANFAFNSSNMARQIVVGALTRTATSAFDGHTASAYGEATYDIQMQDWMLQPLAALSLSRSKTDGFTEQGAGALNLQVAGQTTNSVKTLFGAKAQFEVGQVKLEPRLAWGHEFGDANAPMTMQFAGSAAPSFLVSGVKLPRNSVIAGLGLSSNISKGSNSNLSLFADVQGEYNSRQSNVALLVGIRSRW
ncbi:autotransporter domain-containing protein [Herminiimonas arsenitoxidans]|uniref:autotransporter domain-containing protein n=1 Tax=Herminiimonas arsenitoxidans TaxID=1809410 RepID=UPI0009704550|nr:autotransporter domain-containing protein [Herminiimonas arsenitoxidans]